MVAGSAEQVVATLTRYAEAGAEHVVCRIAAPDLDSRLDRLEMIAGVVRP